MWKWIGRGLLIAILAVGGYAAYDYYRGGFHKMPLLPPGAFPLSFKSGFRAIMVGVDVDTETRRYRGYPATNVPDWYLETWSFCRPFSEDEQAEIQRNADFGPGHRWEAVCEIDADGETVIRGWIASVPNN